jgi:uncharacterized membrane protein
MDGFWVFLALAGVVFVFLGPIGFFLAISARRRLQIAERKILALEAQMRVAQGLSAAAPATQTGEAPSARPAQTEEIKPEGEREAAWANDSIGEAENPPSREQQTEPVEPPPLLAQPPRRSLEEALGAHWAVYVGGVALALGGLLLVRYSIEQGWFGPGARVLLGLLFAFTLVAVGEVLRRREKTAEAVAHAAGEPASSTLTPAVLTAAGTVAGFGAIYAAHALYHFIGPAIAFVALGAAGLAAMLSAALHGPALAGIGLAGALATPLLVQSDAHNAWPAVIYVAIVTAATYGLARLRTWLWLALAGATGAILWGLMFGLDGSEPARANYVYVVIQTALASFVFVFDRRIAAPEHEAKLDLVSTLGALAFGWLTVAVLFSGAVSGAFDLDWMLSGGAVVAILAVTGALALPAAGVIAGAGVLVLAILWIWPGDGTTPEAVKLAQDVLWVWFAPLEPARFSLFATLGAGLVAWLSGITLYRGPNLPSPIALIHAGTATLTPLAALALAYLRLTHSDASLPFGVIAGLLAVAFLLAAIAFRQRLSEASSATLHLGLGVMASAALAALALGVVFMLDRGMLTVALALAALGAAIVESRLSIPALRWAVAGLGLVVAGRLAYEPRIVGAGLGATPIFNWLLFGYGVPAAAFGLAARMMRRASGEDRPVQIAQALSLLFSALLAILAVALARMADGVRPQWFVVGARIEALVLVFLLVTLETRRFFETDLIGWRNPASEAENYAYSAVWLALGIVLLAFGLWRASREVRLASGLFVVAAVLKVFLYDLAQLEGILRALSFIGLGAVLIGIGLVYQKLIFPRSSQT